jgi:4-hydroxy-tetrahydrodipicolinate reductase
MGGVLKVAVLGAGGRVGRVVAEAVARAHDLELAAAIDPAHAGELVAAGEGRAIAASIEELEERGVEVAVDFTTADAARANLAWLADHGVHAVVGTTGLGDADLEALGARFERSGASCLVVPNFAIGAVVMARLAAIAARYLEGAEIVELHHDRKLDAPSGTARATARAMLEARREAGLDPWPPPPSASTGDPAARGATVFGVQVHAVRLPGLVAHQEVVLGAPGQALTIRHDVFDRSAFVPGVLLAIRTAPGRRGLSVGLEALLDL